MPTRTIMNDHQAKLLTEYLRNMPMPFTVTVNPGRLRSTEQNRLQRLWLAEIADQRGDMTAEEVRGHAKLHFGVPILRNENEAWRVEYDRIVKPLPYEVKLRLMQEPLSFPVTSVMTTKQKTAFLDAMHRFWAEQGVILTEPEAA